MEGNLKDLRDSMPASVAEACQRGEAMVMLEKVTGPESIVRYIEFELINTTAMLNMNPGLLLQAHQVPIVAQMLFNNFKSESLEDFSLAFKRGVMGFYNPDGLFRVDGAVVTHWVRSYLEEKYAHIEIQHAKEKNKNKDEETEVDYSKVAYSRQGEREKDEIERKRKDADFMMYKTDNYTRPKFLCDGIVIQAVDEQYARIAFKQEFGRDPETVALKNESETPK